MNAKRVLELVGRIRLQLVGLVAVSALTVGIGALPDTVLASASRTAFAGHVYGCGGTPPADQFITNGGTLHFSGATNQNLVVTGNPLVDGPSSNVVRASINLRTGSGVALAKDTIEPDAVEGTWEASSHVDISPGALTVTGVGRGTGELQGMTIKFTIEPVTEPVANICNAAHPFVGTIEGEIIRPSS